MCVADDMDHLTGPSESEYEETKIAVSGNEDERIYMVVYAEDLQRVGDENHIGAVFAPLWDVDQVEVPASERWGELRENGICPVSIRPGGHDAAFRLRVLDEALEKKRICSGVHVFKVPQNCYIAHALIIQVYHHGCKEDAGKRAEIKAYLACVASAYRRASAFSVISPAICFSRIS